jgi:hypothetical protein
MGARALHCVTQWVGSRWLSWLCVRSRAQNSVKTVEKFQIAVNCVVSGDSEQAHARCYDVANGAVPAMWGRAPHGPIVP